jgi:hypothetical protein
MRVTVDHHIGIVAFCQPLRCRTSALMAMAYVKTDAADVHHNRFSKLWLAKRIGVAGDGSYWRDQSKLIENLRSAYIPGVKNDCHSLQGIMNSGPQQSVRVRNKSYGMGSEGYHDSFYILPAECRGYDLYSDWA